MKNQNNLLNMMQTGGLTSTSGGAALARALQRQGDIKKLERQKRKEARRQKKGRLFGSIGSIAGSLLGAALAPVTGGTSLAIGAGLGSGIGRRVGEGLGAGKTKQYDRSGTVYGQQAFRDVEQASRDYTRGMGERALASGAQTALSAYLNPTGMYGKVQGKLLKPTGFDVNPAFSMPSSYGAELAGDIDMTASNAEMASLLGDQIAVAPDDMGILSGYANDIRKLKGTDPNFELPSSNLLGKIINYGDNLKTSLSDKFKIYKKEEPSVQASLLGLNDKINQYNNVPSFQNGGLLGYRKGAYVGGGDEDYGDAGTGGSEVITPPDADAPASGFAGTGSPLGNDTGMSPVANATSSSPIGGDSYSASGILGEAGFEPTAEQLALFQQFDPSVINRAKQQSEQGLLSMTGGMGLSSVGGGFGARQRAGSEAVETAGERIGDVAEQAQTDYESQVLGTMANLVAGGAEFGSKAEDKTYVPTDNPGWNPPVAQNEGSSYEFNGKTYYWDGNEWVTEYVRSEDIRAQYDDGNDGYGGS